ncbi:MAG TPA: electron transfer flavoprotein subunit alpha/FixB family protein [Bdellovibrionota bacterium]|nr:electron transfer flavoprotein subunit alpha/FixB family protein [Bdellovibrionota bacterium]
MANDILVLVETKSGKIKKSSCELLSQAKRLADSMGGQVKALVIGKDVSAVVPEAGAYGATEAYAADDASLERYNVERYTSVVAEACKKSQATAFLATANSLGRDLLPRVAARLNTGMITEVTGLSAEGGTIVGKRPIYAGKSFVDVRIPNARPQVISCRPNVFETVAPGGGKAAVTKLTGEFTSMPVKAKITEVVAGKSDKPDLTEASIIVSAGRSIKSADNFKIIREFADVLGAAVGASRAAVDAGYAPHEMQVGQTGKTVNPQLYIACGISGAIQHLAGMRTSKVIVAINTDPECPMFQKADYAIVGDLFQVVPMMTEEFKKILKE